MKQQLKQLISKEIFDLEYRAKMCRESIKYFEAFADVNDPSEKSAECFYTMNKWKNVLRKINDRLLNLRELQSKVKSMTAYITKDTRLDVYNLGGVN